MSDFNFFDGLDEAPIATRPVVPARTPAQALQRVSIANGGTAEHVQVPCPKCGGRGSKTYGYVNIRSYECKLCKGTGKVTQKRIAGHEAFLKGLKTKADNLITRRAEFTDANKAEVEFICRNAEWSDFYRSLRDQLNERGSLSDNQLASIRKGIAKAAERAAEKAASARNAPQVEVSRIEALFASAASAGLKRPNFRALDGIEISRAPAAGRNAGALYVKENGGYAGKIVAGQFHATREATSAVLPRLLAIAADPLGEAKMFGQRTGACCCCGRELTNHASIDAGIGPICAEKWGM